jgi:hypothetical protein
MPGQQPVPLIFPPSTIRTSSTASSSIRQRRRRTTRGCKKLCVLLESTSAVSGCHLMYIMTRMVCGVVSPTRPATDISNTSADSASSNTSSTSSVVFFDEEQHLLFAPVSNFPVLITIVAQVLVSSFGGFSRGQSFDQWNLRSSWGHGIGGLDGFFGWWLVGLPFLL